MDKMRKEFEKWAVSTKDHFGLPFFTIKNVDGKYVDHGTEISWKAWQASRQALVVELPELCDGENSCKCYYESDALDAALDAAGIAYR